MFENIRKWWDDYGFEILLGLALLVIIVVAIFRIGKKGSWSKSYYIPERLGKKSGQKPSRLSPKDTHTGRLSPKDSKGERECRRVLEKIFRQSFNKSPT